MTSNTPTPAPGWYPAPHANNEQRYWDGAQWTDWTPASAAAASQPVPASATVMPPGATTAPAPATTATLAEAPVKKSGLRWWAWLLIAFGALLLLTIVIGAINGAGRSDGDDPQARPAATRTAAAPVQEPEPEVSKVDVPNVVGKTVAEARSEIVGAGLAFKAADGSGDDWVVLTQTTTEPSDPGTEVAVTAEAPKPVYTVEQQNALRSARSYLDFTSFSRSGLIQQLSSEFGEGFPIDVATWAADTVGADWNAEAAEAATSYLEFSSFSRDGLFEQLTSEYGSGFTPDEANYALGQVGY